MNDINWSTTKEDTLTINAIADRAMNLGFQHPKMEILMDISAAHANGCPLRLKDLLDADDFNFMHDIVGIRKHLNRETGQLDGRFLPRFAV